MNKWVLLILITCSPFLSKGQDNKNSALIIDYYDSPQNIKNVIKTNPLTPIIGAIPYTAEYRIVYEFINAKDQSSQIAVSYLGRGPFVSMMEDSIFQQQNQKIRISFNGFRLQTTYKFYINRFAEKIKIGMYKYAPYGYYIAPHLSYATAKIADDISMQNDAYLRITHFNVNLLLGYQFFALKVMAIDVFVGLGYKKNWWIEHNSSNNIKKIDTEDLGDFYNGPLKVNLGFNMGFGF